MRRNGLVEARKARKDQEATRWEIIQRASRLDCTLNEAARLSGMKPAGLKSLLYRKLKDTNWPIKEEAK